MSKKSNTQEFKQQVYDLVGDEYTVLTEYTGCRNKLWMRHNSEYCNFHEYEVTPNKFKDAGRRCPICANLVRSKKRSFTHNDFVKQVYDLVGDEYTVLTKYQGNTGKIWFRHNCEYCGNYEYESTPNYFIQGKRCKVCSGSIINDSSFKHDFYKKFGNEKFEIEGEYIDYDTPVTIRHIGGCNKTFTLTPNHIRQPRTDRILCPNCEDERWYGESVIKDYLLKNNIDFRRQVTFDDLIYKKNLYFDFAIFYGENKDTDYFLLEYDGEQHNKEFDNYFKGKFSDTLEIRQKRDEIKNSYCEENHIPLLRVTKKNLKHIGLTIDKFIEKLK